MSDRLDGLDVVLASARGATVLDLGSAEGMIGRRLSTLGAARVDAVDRSSEMIECGKRICLGHPMRFHVADLDDAVSREALRGALLPGYDIVLLLGLLQKVRRPAPLLAWAASFARGLVVVRAPASAFRPKRDPSAPAFDAATWLWSRFDLVDTPATSQGWLGIYRVTA